MEKKKHYIVELQVRDYECDTQGRVNNAIFLQYFEHARSQVFWERGYSLSQLHLENEDPVVARIEVDYRQPLQARDLVRIETELDFKKTYKIVFQQTLLKQSNAGYVLAARALVVVAVLKSGKPAKIADTRLASMIDGA